MTTSWKTSIFGLCAALGTAILAGLQSGILDPSHLPLWFKNLAVLMSIVGSAGMGIFARDNNVSSEQAGAKTSPGAQKMLFLLVVGFALSMTAIGCKTRLESGGAYAPVNVVTNADGTFTTNAAVAPDPAFFVADEAYKTAYDLVDGVLKLEYENRAQVAAISPAIRPALDKIRPTVWEIDQSWAKARQAYKANPTPAGLTSFQSIVAKMQELVPVAQSGIAPFVSAQK